MVNTRLLLTLIITFVTQYNPVQAMFGAGFATRLLPKEEAAMAKQALTLTDAQGNPFWLDAMQKYLIEHKHIKDAPLDEKTQQAWKAEFARFCRPELRQYVTEQPSQAALDIDAERKKENNAMFYHLAHYMGHYCAHITERYDKQLAAQDVTLTNIVGEFDTIGAQLDHLVKLVMREFKTEAYGLWYALDDALKVYLNMPGLIRNKLEPHFRERAILLQCCQDGLFLIPPQDRSAMAERAMKLHRLKLDLTAAGQSPVTLQSLEIEEKQGNIMLKTIKQMVAAHAQKLAQDVTFDPEFPLILGEKDLRTQQCRHIRTYVAKEHAFMKGVDYTTKIYIENYANKILDKNITKIRLNLGAKKQFPRSVAPELDTIFEFRRQQQQPHRAVTSTTQSAQDSNAAPSGTPERKADHKADHQQQDG